jgi:hypothetical protein
VQICEVGPTLGPEILFEITVDPKKKKATFLKAKCFVEFNAA